MFIFYLFIFLQELECSIYNRLGRFDIEWCVTVDITDTYVFCELVFCFSLCVCVCLHSSHAFSFQKKKKIGRCHHFSNFGLLFGIEFNDDWTTYRIVSLALLCGVWVLLLIFFALVIFSAEFRIVFRLETGAEMTQRALGPSSYDPGVIADFDFS